MSRSRSPRTSDDAPVRAGVYVRISRDREGAGLGVERQEDDCRALASRLGWEVVDVYVDNDISAYSGRARPGYRAMVEDVRTGRISGVLAWHTDRLHRRTSELEEFVELAETHGLQVQTVTAGAVDLSSASGRMVARMLGAAAAHEIDHARERMRAAKAQAAQQGKYRGGPRPYGYRKDGRTVKPAEAKIIREACEAVLAGRSLAGVANELNARGSTTSTGRPWDYMRLRDVLLRPRNAGLLHSGRVGRPDFEIVGKAVWPAIVDEETWQAVYKLLSDPSRRTSASTEKKHLLSGIARCGREDCEGVMRTVSVGGTESRPGSRVRHYRCSDRPHLQVRADEADEYVREVVGELLTDPRVVAGLSRDDERDAADRQRRAVLARRLEGFEHDYMEGTITGALYAKARAKVEAEMATLDERLTVGARRGAAGQVMNALDPAEAFRAAPIDVQRAVLSLVLDVTVLPSTRRGAAWTAERLRIESAAHDG